MEEIYQNIFNTEIISEEIYSNILQELSINIHLEKLVPKGIISITKYYNSLIEIEKLTEEEILKIPKTGIGKLIKIKDFQNKIKENKNYFINYYCLNKAIIKIPFNYNEEQDVIESFYEMMRDLAIIYNLRSDVKSKRNAELIKLYFGVDGPYFSRDEISEKLNIVRQRVDQILTKPNNSVIMQLFLTNIPQDRIMVDNVFFDKVIEIKLNSLWNHKFIDSITSVDNPDLQFASRFAENLQCYLTEIEEDNFLVEQSNAVFFREHYRALKQTMNEQIEPLLFNEICDLVSKEIKKIKLQPEFIKKLLEQDIYESIITDEEEIKYSIQWDLLSTVLSRVKRILFEENRPLLRDEILEEYNYRLLEKNLDLISNDNLIFRSDKQLISLGNNNWSYSNESDNSIKNRLNTWSFIEQYVQSQDGISNFESIKNEIIQENYSHPDNSIRAYILKSCYVSKKNKNIFIHKQMTDKHREFEYFVARKGNIGNKIMETAIDVLLQNRNVLNVKILYDKIIESCSEEGVLIERKQYIDYNIKKLIEADILYEADGKMILDTEASVKFDELNFRKEPKYKSTIRSLAVNYLKSINNKETSLQELWRISKQYYPENIVKNNFYKIFNDSSIFNKITIENKQYLNLNTSLLPIPKEYTEEVIEPVEEFIPQEPIENIELNTRIKFNLEELTIQLKKELKNGFNMSESTIENGIYRFYKALKNNEKFSRWGESLLQSIYELWFTKTDFYDREVCLIKLTTNYETYIKNLHPTSLKTSGLVDVLKANPILSELHSYKFECQKMDKQYIDYSKRNYSKAVHSLIYFRNLYAHNTDADSLDMGISNQIGYATDFIALYIYSAVILNGVD